MPSIKLNKKPFDTNNFVMKNGATMKINIANKNEIVKVIVSSFAVIFSSFPNC